MKNKNQSGRGTYSTRQKFLFVGGCSLAFGIVVAVMFMSTTPVRHSGHTQVHKDASQVRGIVQSMAIWANSESERVDRSHLIGIVQSMEDWSEAQPETSADEPEMGQP